MKSKGFTWDDLDLSLSEGDLQQDLLKTVPPVNGIYGVIPLQRFLEDLEHHGLLERLRQRGYRGFRPDCQRFDETGERLRLFASHLDHTQEFVLMDCKSRLGYLENYRALGWDWLEMRDPLAQPSPYRPTLPGQHSPGLGLFRGMTRVMLEYIPLLKIQALTAVPQYFHNAVLYSSHFVFLDPQAQGRFLAMCRDLLHEGLASASWWVYREEVWERDRQSGEEKPFTWKPERIVRGLCPELQARLTSAEYQEACLKSQEAVEYSHRP